MTTSQATLARSQMYGRGGFFRYRLNVSSSSQGHILAGRSSTPWDHIPQRHVYQMSCDWTLGHSEYNHWANIARFGEHIGYIAGFHSMQPFEEKQKLLNWIQYLTGSQWSEMSPGVMWFLHNIYVYSEPGSTPSIPRYQGPYCGCFISCTAEPNF